MTEKVFNTSTLDGTNGFIIINGNTNDDNLGYSVSNAGDINGDGIEDLIIGAPQAAPNDKNNAGKSYIVFGTNKGFTSTIDISTLNGINGFTVIGSAEGDASGRSVSAAGDVNGDGIEDLIIGAPSANINGEDSGAAYVIFGKNSFSSNATIDVSNLNGNGVVINGLAEEDRLGYSVSSAGDINNDGFDDLIIGAPNAYTTSNDKPGQTYIVFGQSNFDSSFDLSSLDGSNGFIINGQSIEDYSGLSVSSAGDINNDGIDDLIIGAPQATPNGTNSGQAYIVFGKESDFSPSLDLNSLDGSNGFIINGEEYSKLGFSVSSAGDVNDDGIDDLIIGAHDADPNGITNAGISYVIFGQDGNFDSSFDLSSLNGNNGFAINGINEFDNSGWSVSGIGDISGDGIDDLIISANNADPNGESSGQSYVVFGKNNFDSAINLSDIDGTNGFIINGIDEFDNLGNSVSGAGDVNGDGIADLILSAPFAEDSGESYVIFGINSAPTDLLLDNNSIDENVADETIIGQFTTTDINSEVQNFTYSLVDDANYPDNSFFTIDGENLIINVSPDFEAKSSYVIRVKTTDQGGLSSEKEFTININDIDETDANAAPTDLELTVSTIDENIAAETVIGTFTTTDQDSGDTFSYSLVDDANYPDNSFFTIDGENLKINASPDFEAKSSYVIRVKTTDQGGLSSEKEFTININDIDETDANVAPTDLELTVSTIDENIAAETIIGTFTTTDQDSGDTFSYSLVDDANYPDNSFFTIDGESLKINASPDFETKSSYNINVKTTDAGGLSFVKSLTINVNDIDENEDPTTGGASTTKIVKVSDDGFKIESPNSRATLKITLAGINSTSVNELVAFTVDDASGKIGGIAPGEAGYTEAALAKGKIIFSTIAKIPNKFDSSDINKLLGVDANTNLRFYFVDNGSTDSVKAGITPISNVIFPNSSTLEIKNLGDNKFSLGWKDSSVNSQNFDNLVFNIQATDNPLPLGTGLQDSPQGENIDLRNVTGLVNAEFTVYREAAFDNYVGFYKVTDENGGIDINGDGTADILPGQAGYTQAAVNQHLSTLGLSVANGQTATFNGTLDGGAIYVPFLIANSRPDAVLDSNPNNDPAVYFTFLGANSDKADHVRLLGDNTFGFEDLANGGDQDFNDIVVKVNLQTIV